MQARVVGEGAVLLMCAEAAEVFAAYERAREEAPDALDVVPAARTVLVDGVTDPEDLARRAGEWTLRAGSGPQGELVEVPVTYDGPDLAEVARRWGMTTAQAAAFHRDREYLVAFCGFAPGFPYLTGLPQEYAVPRRDDPRERVPPGSVGLAGPRTGIYPTASPGGWQLIGRTDLSLWDQDADPPATLPPGTRVRFVDA